MAVISKNGLYWQDQQTQKNNTNVANQALKSLQVGGQAAQQPTMASLATSLPKAQAQPNAGINTNYGYTPSQSVLDAYNYLQAMINSRPADYVSQYKDQLQGMLDQIMNREDFHYDALSDPIYQLYRDQYIMGGKRAMQDTMGQAAALTGGYGNSYAQSVGQQAYNQYMEGLNNIIPDLQQQAYQRYVDEGDQMAQNYQLLNQAENQDYGRYRDTYEDWQTERQLAENSYNSERGFDYGAFSDKRTYDQQESQFAQQMALQQAQLALQREQFEWQKEQAKKKSSGGGSSSKSSTAAATPSTEVSKIKTTNATNFYNSLVDESDFNKGKPGISQFYSDTVDSAGNKQSAYANYVEDQLAIALSQGRLTYEEAEKVVNRFNSRH